MLALSGCVTPQSTELPQRRAIAAEVAPSAQPPAAFAPQAAARVARSNASVAADFMDLTFRMESGRSIETFSRFEGPVRVAMTGQVPPPPSATCRPCSAACAPKPASTSPRPPTPPRPASWCSSCRAPP